MALAVVAAPALGPRRGVQFGRIAVEGDRHFVNRVGAALRILEQKDPEAYDLVERHVPRITQGQHSGMWAYENPPRLELGPATANSSVTWLSGAIAHDAMHAKLYAELGGAQQKPVPDEAWSGVVAERTCCRYQAQVLERIGGTQAEIDWCNGGDGTHGDVNGDGKLDWDDYRKRDW